MERIKGETTKEDRACHVRWELAWGETNYGAVLQPAPRLSSAGKTVRPGRCDRRSSARPYERTSLLGLLPEEALAQPLLAQRVEDGQWFTGSKRLRKAGKHCVACQGGTRGSTM